MELEEAEEAARRLVGAFRSSHAEIHVNAGGVGVWISTTACVITLFLTLSLGTLGALWVSREFSRYDAEIIELKKAQREHADYLAAIYMQAPHLKPKDREDQTAK